MTEMKKITKYMPPLPLVITFLFIGALYYVAYQYEKLGDSNKEAFIRSYSDVRIGNTIFRINKATIVGAFSDPEVSFRETGTPNSIRTDNTFDGFLTSNLIWPTNESTILETVTKETFHLKKIGQDSRQITLTIKPICSLIPEIVQRNKERGFECTPQAALKIAYDAYVSNNLLPAGAHPDVMVHEVPGMKFTGFTNSAITRGQVGKHAYISTDENNNEFMACSDPNPLNFAGNKPNPRCLLRANFLNRFVLRIGFSLPLQPYAQDIKHSAFAWVGSRIISDPPIENSVHHEANKRR